MSMRKWIRADEDEAKSKFQSGVREDTKVWDVNVWNDDMLAFLGSLGSTTSEFDVFNMILRLGDTFTCIETQTNIVNEMYRYVVMMTVKYFVTNDLTL